MTSMPWDIPVPNRPASPPPAPRWWDRGNSATTVAPTPGVLPGQNLKSWANWRAFLYTMIPVAVTGLTAVHLQFGDRISVWTMLALAVVGPLVSSVNTTDKLRQIAYGVLGLLQTAGYVATLLVGYETWIPVVSAVVTILSATLARYYTPTSTLQPLAPYWVKPQPPPPATSYGGAGSRA